MVIDRLIIKLKVKRWIRRGLKVGTNFQIEKNVSIDPSFPWLVEIGDHVSMAPDCIILAHDGSTKSFLNYSKVGKVQIGNHVFIGARSVILPNVTIGDNVIIGAGSVVLHDIESDKVVAGVPAKVISSIENFQNKYREIMRGTATFDSSYTLAGKVNSQKKAQMSEQLKGSIGFIE